MRILRLAQAGVAALGLAIAASGSAQAAGGSIHYEAQDWSFSGIFGTFDQASAQRGYQVYKEVCAGCHAMSLLRFRDLEGIGLPEHTIKVLSSEATKMAINGDGEEVEVARLPSDPFPSPFANEQAARASNGGAYPPDLSLMAKARAAGADYIYALMTGYHEAPAGVEMNEGMHYNSAFEGHQIAMAAPLYDEGVEFADGTKATIDQQARDIATFLTYAAEPHMEDRKRTGLKVVMFLFILTVMLYFVKKKVWADLH